MISSSDDLESLENEQNNGIFVISHDDMNKMLLENNSNKTCFNCQFSLTCINISFFIIAAFIIGITVIFLLTLLSH